MDHVTMADVKLLLDLIDEEAKRRGSVCEQAKGTGSEVASWTISRSEYQGVQRIMEDRADEYMPASFSDGPGYWKCLRFGDGDKTYELTLREVG